MKRRKVILVWTAVLLAIAGGFYFALPSPQYLTQANGLVRIDTETGRKQIFMDGKWMMLPEVRRNRLQSQVETKMTEQLERRLVTPVFELPAVKAELPAAKK